MATKIGDKIFAGKTFVSYGFDEEGIPALTAYIKEGGDRDDFGTVARGRGQQFQMSALIPRDNSFDCVVLQTSDRRIPDYAIVPMDGFPVDRTVNNIVTNTLMVRLFLAHLRTTGS
ncbi:hypothetical protein DPMN_079249 [Dreissena polymorpha]|uniref:Uncharacterized protein n=1 Tax=Dreissena polymorpha TaxID=45954 RepID=A0A9D4BQX1_DREPO|nr:hypothetical protein DPMN_079249 [Dreissena polymorpha]